MSGFLSFGNAQDRLHYRWFRFGPLFVYTDDRYRSPWVRVFGRLIFKGAAA